MPCMLAIVWYGMPPVGVSTGVVIGVAVAMSAAGIFMTPRLLLDISRNSFPSFLYTIMSNGRLPAPSSATVVPRTLSPGLSEAIGNLTSGVHEIPGDEVRLPVHRVRNEGVHWRPGLQHAVIAVVDLDARARIDRVERVRNRAQLRRELLVRQACRPQLPIGERKVGDGIGPRILPRRRRWPPVRSGAPPSGTSRVWSETMSILPEPSTRNSAGAAPAPWPRITET